MEREIIDWFLAGCALYTSWNIAGYASLVRNAHLDNPNLNSKYKLEIANNQLPYLLKNKSFQIAGATLSFLPLVTKCLEDIF